MTKVVPVVPPWHVHSGKAGPRAAHCDDPPLGGYILRVVGPVTREILRDVWR